MESKQLWFKIMDAVSTAMLLTIFLCVFKTLTTNSLEEIFSIWKIIAINYITFAIISGVMLFNIYIRYKIKITEFFNKLSEVFLTVLSTGSTTIVMSKNIEIASKEFKIE
jgi:Na+/H+-dicarboxylate symporter